jgi:hypothetical protein
MRRKFDARAQADHRSPASAPPPDQRTVRGAISGAGDNIVASGVLYKMGRLQGV